MSPMLYELRHSPATVHYAETWDVFGAGFGLRGFSTKDKAIEAATAYFGIGKIIINSRADKTEIHIENAPILAGVDPVKVLDNAIDALIVKRDFLLEQKVG